MTTLAGLSVDADHLMRLFGCCGVVRKHGQVPAVVLVDAAVPGALTFARSLGATDADRRTVDLSVELETPTLGWQDPSPVTRRQESAQLLTNADRLGRALTQAGQSGPADFVRSLDSMPKDAVVVLTWSASRIVVAACQHLACYWVGRAYRRQTFNLTPAVPCEFRVAA